VIGSDPKGRLGEAPELHKHAWISGACFDAAAGITPELEVKMSVSITSSPGTIL
jgi:UDP-arabinose 4-epimerase